MKHLGPEELLNEILSRDPRYTLEAYAFVRGGQYDLAEAILASGPDSTDLDILDQYTFLKVEVLEYEEDFSAQ